MRPAARQAAEQTGQCQGIADALVDLRQGLERQIRPAEAPGRLGQGVWQHAGAGAERGEGRRGGQARVAQGEVERVHPGMRVGEEPGGLGQREAREQAGADRVGGGRDAGVEPGQRVGGIGQPASSTGRSAPTSQSPSPDAGGFRRRGRRSASVSSGVSSQGGRSHSSAVSSSAANGVLAAIAAFPQALVFSGPCYAIRADSGAIGSSLRGFLAAACGGPADCA